MDQDRLLDWNWLDNFICYLGGFCNRCSSIYNKIRALLIMNAIFKKSIPFVLIIAAVPILVLLYFFVYPLYSQYFPKCFFYLITGLHCPGCGSQRAIVSLLHGNFSDALHNNLLAVAALPFLFYSFVALGINTHIPGKIDQKIFYNPLFVKVVLTIVIVFSVLRNIPSYPFNLLAPLQ